MFHQKAFFYSKLYVNFNTQETFLFGTKLLFYHLPAISSLPAVLCINIMTSSKKLTNIYIVCLHRSLYRTSQET